MNAIDKKIFTKSQRIEILKESLKNDIISTSNAIQRTIENHPSISVEKLNKRLSVLKNRQQLFI